VPSDEACTPLPATPCVIPDGRVGGGQYFVQPPVSVHVTLPPFSVTRTYRVRPSPLTRTLPTPGTLATLTVTEALDALDPAVVVLDPVVGVGDPAAGLSALVAVDVDGFDEELQAANRNEAPARARIGTAMARCLLKSTDEVIAAFPEA